MKPRLVHASGQGEWTLESGSPITIGRDNSNSIVLDDPTVSSRHCVIEAKGDHAILNDTDSTNGTVLNGVAVKSAPLTDGDAIDLGRVRLYFLLDERSRKADVQLHDAGEWAVVTATQIDPARSALLELDSTTAPAETPRTVRDLKVVLQLGTEIAAIDDSMALQSTLLERIFEVLPAEQGAILLLAAGGERFLPQPVSKQRVPTGRDIRVSRSVTEEVMRTGLAVRRNNISGDETSSESLTHSHVHSVLCVPLTFLSTRVGLIYLDTTNPSATFDDHHLELLVAIAGIACVALEHARYVEWLETENRELQHQVDLQHEMIGDSAAMRRVYEAIGKVAPVTTDVLILGESGTGKELAARAIHRNSPRRNGPFVEVNCGAISPNLFESEFFGHVKGAFTDAHRDRKGWIEQADGGTLFLDELGELPPEFQAKLLRVLEDRMVRPVGSEARPAVVDVRVICATNRNLEAEIAAGRFKRDLYYRLGLPISMPPLRDRPDDIPLLVRHFVQRFGKHRHVEATPPDTIRVLQDYSWPGNVRQLAHTIEWAVVFGKSDRIRPEDLPPEVRGSGPDRSAGRSDAFDNAVRSFERQFIIQALEKTGGQVVEAARLIGRAPNYLQRRINQLDLRTDLERIRSSH